MSKQIDPAVARTARLAVNFARLVDAVRRQDFHAAGQSQDVLRRAGIVVRFQECEVVAGAPVN